MGNTNLVSPLRGWLGGKYRLAGTIIFKEVRLRYSVNKDTSTEADELLIANYPINTDRAEPA